MPLDEFALRRKTYAAFKSGAELRTEDVQRLLASRGHTNLSKNRLNNFSRDTDRAAVITSLELYDLISAWALEMRGPAEQEE